MLNIKNMKHISKFLKNSLILYSFTIKKVTNHHSPYKSLSKVSSNSLKSLFKFLHRNESVIHHPHFHLLQKRHHSQFHPLHSTFYEISDNHFLWQSFLQASFIPSEIGTKSTFSHALVVTKGFSIY